jgi:hypothetical protein
VDILIRRRNGFDRNPILQNDPVKKLVESIRIARGYQQSQSVRMHSHFDGGVLLKDL